MKKIKLLKRITVCTLILLLTIPFSAMSQPIEEKIAGRSSENIFKPEELEQILAPIALYPDALLAQVLTAATYPLEVVAADRFVNENEGLKNEALLRAAKDKDWEPSVKAMLEFPNVLAMMDEQLEWTKKLGDAFLSQQSDCMDAIQRLRQKAYVQGNLVTTEKQVIRVEPQTQIIIIEPASPEIVYVPVYNTAIIYGQWRYPGYPPYYFYSTRYSNISFFAGVFVGAFWGAWETWDCNWYSRDVHINVDRYNHFTRASYAENNRYWFYKAGQNYQPWRYDARHRTSAGSRDYFPVQRFSKQQSPSVTKNSRNNQSSKKKQPAQVLKENVVNQVNKKSTPLSNLTGDLRDGRKDRIIARPASNDLSRSKNDTRALTAKGRERNSQQTNYKQSNRQIPASLKGSNVLFEGQINVATP
jgi:hypothetical protein